MPINFITNDPRASGASVRTITPRPSRPAAKMSFKVTSLPPPAVYATDTVKFVAWQALEGALMRSGREARQARSDAEEIVIGIQGRLP